MDIQVLFTLILGAVNPLIDDGIDQVACKAGTELRDLVDGTTTTLDNTAAEKLFLLMRTIEGYYNNPPAPEAVADVAA